MSAALAVLKGAGLRWVRGDAPRPHVVAAGHGDCLKGCQGHQTRHPLWHGPTSRGSATDRPGSGPACVSKAELCRLAELGC